MKSFAGVRLTWFIASSQGLGINCHLVLSHLAKVMVSFVLFHRIVLMFQLLLETGPQDRTPFEKSTEGFFLNQGPFTVLFFTWVFLNWSNFSKGMRYSLSCSLYIALCRLVAKCKKSSGCNWSQPRSLLQFTWKGCQKNPSLHWKTFFSVIWYYFSQCKKNRQLWRLNDSIKKKSQAQKERFGERSHSQLFTGCI